MSWQVYKVIFRLRSPMHIGRGKIGNLQRTNHYVTGRVMWGALSRRITRDKILREGLAESHSLYRAIGEEVHESLAFTYFFLALQDEKDYKVIWPWEDKNQFCYRFLSSFTGTALSKKLVTAEGSLRETEYISPYTLDQGDPVFLMGYVFEKQGCNLRWKEAMHRLKLGGEGGYGWGTVSQEKISSVNENILFDKNVSFEIQAKRPLVVLAANQSVVAHTSAEDANISGMVEPLVGREWRNYAGQHIAFNDVYYIPGSKVEVEMSFIIDNYGVWRQVG